MYSEPLAGHPELWQGISTVPESNGPEADLKMWEEAEGLLDHLCKLHECSHNDAVVVALSNAYNLCIEERRRAEDLFKLHKVWEGRRIGGVVEPESAVRGTA
jgi:hypothetical protein